MDKKDFKYIYGPVYSWRLGRSLGIDPISEKDKICTFDCVYCQIGRTYKYGYKREKYLSVNEVIDEIKSLPDFSAKNGDSSTIDYITFSGSGEPTLADNMGQMIKAIRATRSEKIAVITNSSLIYREDVINDLLLTDFVIAKLDACSQESLKTVNRPVDKINFNVIMESLKYFRNIYKGKYALQVMFINENKNIAKEISAIAKEIKPDEVQINTPLRPCRSKPLPKGKIEEIKECFRGMNCISVYDIEKKKVEPISTADTLKRRGKI